MVTRKILHLDLDAFFCAVEEHRDPKLRGQPFAVGGQPDQRGVVASCSYAARRLGIHSAMPMATAVKLYPKLIIVPARHKTYREESDRVMAILRELTPLVEQISIDEAFLDLTERPESAETLARRLQHTINTRLDLSCSLGVATNKLVAKIANNIGKAQGAGSRDEAPNAIQVVPPGTEAAFIAPLPVRELWGVVPKTEERLAAMGITTIGDITKWPEFELSARFGKHGTELAQRALGLDDRPIETEREIKSVSKETTFTRDVRDREVLRRELHQLVQGVCRQLRHNDLRGSTIKIKLLLDFTTLTRQITLDLPTNQEIPVYIAAMELFDQTWAAGRAVRLIGVGVSGFTNTQHQLELGLFSDPPPEESGKLRSALDDLRDKFGDKVVQRGKDLRRKSSG